jgi:hypothetical protein
MKIFLQDSNTAQFMRCDSTWAMDIQEALDFLSVQRAVFFGMKELKEPFQVVQAEPDGLQSPITITIPQLQWPKVQVLPALPHGFREQAAPPRRLRRQSACGLLMIPPMMPAKFLRSPC